MRLWFLYLIILLVHFNGFSQAQYVISGIILFENKINYLKTFDESSFPSNYIEEHSRFITKKYELSFNNLGSLYKSVNGRSTGNTFIESLLPTSKKEIYHEYFSCEKYTIDHIYDKQYKIYDSACRTEWMLFDEKRTIAGFECRKAIQYIQDSMLVVAFFSEDFLTSSGPEGFFGLPGMILGLVIPRLHSTWYAVEVKPDPKNQKISFNKGGPWINRNSLLQLVREEFSKNQSLIEKVQYWLLF